MAANIRPVEGKCMKFTPHFMLFIGSQTFALPHYANGTGLCQMSIEGPAEYRSGGIVAQTRGKPNFSLEIIQISDSEIALQSLGKGPFFAPPYRRWSKPCRFIFDVVQQKHGEAVSFAL